MTAPTLTDVCDVDLLLGRDPVTALAVTVDGLARWRERAHLTGGLLASQRALCFDADSGNAEVAAAAPGLGLSPVVCLETRDWLGARRIVESLPAGAVVRLAPQRQDCLPTHPGFLAIVRAVVERDLLVLCEGDVRVWAPPFAGRRARVVFLDAHFYHLGDLVAIAADEPGFHASTRLLNGPDSLSLIRDELGIERLVFGSRDGFHEGRSALLRLATAPLSDADRRAVAGDNLRRLLGGRP